MSRRVPRATLDRLFPPDIVPYVEVLIVPADPTAPIRPVVDVRLVPRLDDVKQSGQIDPIRQVKTGGDR